MADMLTIVIPDLAPFMADIEAVGGDAQPLADAAMTNSLRLIQAAARDLAPHRTGGLQQSILTEGGYPVGIVTVNAPYGRYVEYGTGLYGPNKARIYPKNKKALHWGGSPGFFAKSIAGMHAKPYFTPAVGGSTEAVVGFFETAIETMRNALAGK